MRVISELPDSKEKLDSHSLEWITETVLALVNPETEVEFTARMQTNAFLAHAAVRFATSFEVQSKTAKAISSLLDKKDRPLKEGDKVVVIKCRAYPSLLRKEGVVTEVREKTANNGFNIGVLLNNSLEGPMIFFRREDLKLGIAVEYSTANAHDFVNKDD